MEPYRIILADDHVLVRQGIRKIIQENPEMEVIGEAGDGLELMNLLKKSRPHLVILDISMPKLRGLEATKRIKELYPEVKVLILTMHRSKEYLCRALEFGASGYLLKEDADLALFSAIEAVRQGRVFISPLLAA
jgi:DNA-binding NarL/FixJ family response regulator